MQERTLGQATTPPRFTDEISLFSSSDHCASSSSSFPSSIPASPASVCDAPGLSAPFCFSPSDDDESVTNQRGVLCISGGIIGQAALVTGKANFVCETDCGAGSGWPP